MLNFVIFLSLLSLSVFAFEKEPVPIEELAPKVRFVGLAEDGKVIFEFKEINIEVTIKTDEEKLAKYYPKYLKALQESFNSNNKWKSL